MSHGAKPQLHLRVDSKILRVVDDVCKVLGITRSELVRNAIIYYLSYLKSASFLTDVKNAYNKTLQTIKKEEEITHQIK